MLEKTLESSLDYKEIQPVYPKGKCEWSHSVVSDSLQPHGLQYARLPCPTPNPRACSTHIHQVSEVIQSSHSLSFFSPPIFNLSQQHGLFQEVSSSHQVAKVLEFQLQHQSFQWVVQDQFPLGLTGLISLQSKALWRVFSNTTVQKHQLSVLSFLYSPTRTSIHDYWKNHSFD